MELFMFAAIIAIAWWYWLKEHRRVERESALLQQQFLAKAARKARPAEPAPRQDSEPEPEPGLGTARKHPHWPAWGEFEVDVVGESFNRRTLQALMHGAEQPATAMYATATLRPQHDNPHDVNAVSVAIAGLHVGHLSRNDASAFRRRLADLGLGARITTCDVLVHSGVSEDGRTLDYSVRLDLDLQETPGPDVRPTYGAPRRVDARTSIKRSGKRIELRIPVLPGIGPNLRPGDGMSVRSKPGLSTIHFFAPRSTGGRGRVLVVEKEEFPDLALHLGRVRAEVVSVDDKECRAVVRW